LGTETLAAREIHLQGGMYAANVLAKLLHVKVICAVLIRVFKADCM
jgi:hypoxanthine phosphoribosyltransferase